MSTHYDVDAKVTMVGAGDKSDKSSKQEFYKLEYERAAQRYNEIYSDIWTNFSYMALLAGGILTFGSSFLKNDATLTALLACTPLFFWYMASFLPMNSYGDQVHQRLKQIEGIIEREFGARLLHYRGFQHSDTKTTLLSQLTRPSVRFMIWLFIIGLFLVALVLIVQVYRPHLTGSPMLQVSDLTQPDILADQLKNRKGSISKYILTDEASLRTRYMLDNYQFPGAPSNELKESITNDLNRLIGRGRLSSATDFSQVRLSPETRRLNDQQNLSDGELIDLNRLLLADAYPEGITKFSKASGWWRIGFVVSFLAMLLLMAWMVWLGGKQIFQATPASAAEIGADEPNPAAISVSEGLEKDA